MENVLLIILIILAVIILSVILFKNPVKDIGLMLKDIQGSISEFKILLEHNDRMIREEFQRNRDESNKVARENRDELNKTLKRFEDSFDRNIKDIKETVGKDLSDIREDNSKQLEKMRETVDEKLQKTLNERLSQSFEMVGKQLLAVQEGLGEMKNLASDVGGLKNVLSNVKLRGVIGEVQLGMLLEQIMAPEQYGRNVKTNRNNNEIVEFAIKLPGKDDTKSHVWLPVDAKFPKDVYQKLQSAYEDGDQGKIGMAQKEFDAAIKKNARDIQSKYLNPPYTTDFGIMFLPFEGIYAEVVRKSDLLQELQTHYKVIVTGPTTLAAILNSLQIGFKTLAIQKRSSEVWTVLSEVKKEFGKFGDMMSKAKNNIQTGLNQLDDVMGKRTRAIEKQLNKVTVLPEYESDTMLLDKDS